jgi:hypothetical protein
MGTESPITGVKGAEPLVVSFVTFLVNTRKVRRKIRKKS